MQYRALRKTLDSKPVLVPNEQNISKLVDNINIDWYESLYVYNDVHKARYEENGTLAGIRDTVTNQLYWDFDSSTNIEETFYDAVELINNLHKHGMTSYGIYFTGNKGIGVKVLLNEYIDPITFKTAVYKLADGLKTFDKVVNDPNRVIRLVNSKHPKSGLYKIPLTLEELETLSVEEIRQLAKETRQEPVLVAQVLPKFNVVALPKKLQTVTMNDEIDWSRKPAKLSNCRFSMQNGNFTEGLRSNVLITLAATYKNQGYDLEHTYRLLKGVCVLQSRKNNTERYDDDELYNNIVMQVYGPWWNDGQGSCASSGWMQDYCNGLGEHSCKAHQSNEQNTVKIHDVFSLFDSYVENYEKNVLVTGISDFDKKAKFLVGTSAAILASPSVGKTSLALQMLNHNSNLGIHSLFFSYDMFHGAVITRMIQKHFGSKYGNSLDQIYHRYKNDDSVKQEVKELLSTEYKNVEFCFKSGQSIDDLERTIIDTQKNVGENNLKLVIVDYNELVISEYSDPTSASAQVAQRLRQIANDRQVAVITLLQPSKMHSTPADEIKSYNAAKGSSSIAQSVTLMIGLSRPGFNPLDSRDDKFFNITCLKNRNGGLFSTDLRWDGLTGKISSLSSEEVVELRDLRDRKKEQQSNNGGW